MDRRWIDWFHEADVSLHKRRKRHGDRLAVAWFLIILGIAWVCYCGFAMAVTR